MKEKSNIGGISPHETRMSVMPSGVTSIALLIITMVTGVQVQGADEIYLLTIIFYCLFDGVYLIYFHLALVPSPGFNPDRVWTYAIIQGVSLGLISWILPPNADTLLVGLMTLSAMTACIVVDRKPSYFIILSTTLLIGVTHGYELYVGGELLRLVGPPVIGVVVIEAIQQLKSLAERNVRRLEIINDFTRQITSSLDTNQVLSLLNATVENALEADTYYMGLVNGDEIKMSLLYDDGEYFYDIRTPLDGSLTGWVIKNRKELFLPDMRNEAGIPGVKKMTIGKAKRSLSWMGVPILGAHMTGVLAIASYHPNAFDRGDLELLNNMAQHAAIALDNTHRHAEVEEQTRLDSLTGVYNHGYFLKLLEQQANDARQLRQPLSLIMLDVDHFKQYNDTYGHMAGDQVLIVLCKTIKTHIKKSDAVGRWGGEEFVIALPGADGSQALQVAARIHETMGSLQIESPTIPAIPAPTVSQGIAQYPAESDGIMKLIDLADQRLYVAKQRGRNQIEPDASHWGDCR
jgi:diguanylate cyclase (GGDEF)-like protein